ncbi:MAG TPA: hypothetical protein VD837_07075 [Terriglobales bacterium]|nr:hypothetical protein [Terriglobales bacterium]
MIEQIGNPLTFYAHFTRNKLGATELDVTADVYNPDNEHVATAEDATELADGWYSFTLSAELNDVKGGYRCTFKTADDTVDQQHIPSLWHVVDRRPLTPEISVPVPPDDESLCCVYGYLETIDNQPASGIEISFTLLLAEPGKTERLISGRTITITTDEDGKIVNGETEGVYLQRNDNITPAGSKYLVKCADLKLNKEIELATDLFNLADVID